MGRGGQNEQNGNESDKKTSDTFNYIEMEEVKKHNKKEDCWIVVDNNVYNMTEFQYRHPGGRFVIKQYAGQDATVSRNEFKVPPKLELERLNLEDMVVLGH